MLKTYIKNFWDQIRTIFILSVSALLAGIIVYVLYTYTQNLLTNRLQERLVAIAATAATQFDYEDVEAVQNEKDIEKEEFKKIVGQLIKIREANSNIRYAYIMRRTDDPNVLSFVADAESLLTIEDLDANENGVLEEDEVAPQPGDPFEIDDYPVLKDEAFYHPSVDRELQVDQWSVQLSSYAPILDSERNAVAIVGIDVEVGDFISITRATFLPFLLLILFLVLLLTLLTLLLVRLWNERVLALRELDRQKDELLSIVSHQLATPVSSIKWYIEMLLDGDLGKLNKEQSEHIGMMKGIGANLADLVSMILDVSRIQLGRMKIEKQELDLNQFIKEILEIIKPKAKEKNVKLSIELPKKLPNAMLDKRYTHMTIENLLSNAIKYTKENGNVDFVVEIEDGTMHCKVKDDGVGIPPSEQNKIFGRMFRASNVRNAVDGNGFGLYVAKGAVEAQGGKIWFESKENKGTTFFVELPLK